MALTGLTKVQKVGINTATIPTLGGSENVGVVTATNFIGDGSGLTGVTGSGAGVIVRDGGSLVGTAGTINFGTNLNVSAISAGIVTVTNAASATALTNLSDVTISSPSNGQVLKYNGSAFVNAADTNTTYSQSSVASGSNVNLRLSDGTTEDDILITAGSNITFSSVSAGGFTIASSGGGGGSGISSVFQDTTPRLGGSLDLNNKFITGSGGINVSGVVTATSFAGNITGNVIGDVSGTATNSTNSSHVLVTDNESTDENNLITFVENATSSTGNVGLEMDGNLTYNPSTGNLTATKFTGSGVALTGVVTSIVAGSNISLSGGPTGIVTISSSGGGGLSLSNGTNNNVVTASSATALNGEGNLTFDGTTLGLTGNQTISTNLVVGSATTISNDGVHLTGIATATSFKVEGGGSTRLSLVYGSQKPSPRFGGGTQAASITSFSSDLVIRAGSAHTTNPYVYMGNTSKRVDIGDGNTLTDPSFTTHNEGVNLYGSVIRMLNGGVGIGTTNPTNKLDVIGDVKVSGVTTSTGGFVGNLTGTASTATNVTLGDDSTGSSAKRLLFSSSDSGNATIQVDTSDGATYTPSNGRISAGSFATLSGTSSQFLKADGSVDGNTYLTSGSYLEHVADDNSPQLAADLDLNGNDITGTGDVNIVGLITATSAVTTWTVGNSGASHYTFTGNGFTSATNDPDLYLVRGQRYSFIITSGSSHPFWIKTAAGTGIGNSYNDGVTNNGATSGSLHFNIPFDAPAHLYYQCSAHTDMVGNIYIVGQHLANGANNRVLTATSAYGMNGEANLTFDGTQLSVTGSGTDVLKLTSTDSGAQGVNLILQHNPGATNMADNDVISLLQFAGVDDSNNVTTYSSIRAVATDVSNNSESGDITFHTRNAGTFDERVRIHSGGLVEANSSFSATYSSTTSITPHFRARNQNGTDDIYGGIQLRADRGTGAAAIFNIACLNTSTNFESILAFQSRNSDGNFSEKMRIESDGKVYIGSDSTEFSDEGTFLNLRNNTYGGRIGFSNNTATAGVALMEQFSYWGNNKVAGIITLAGTDTTNKDDGSMHFYTRASGGTVTERIRILADGDIFLGSASVAAVHGNSASKGLVYDSDGGVGNHPFLSVQHGTRSSGNPAYIKFQANSLTEGSINQSNLGFEVSYNNTSDYRLKENVVDLSDAITRLKTLKPRRYNWIADETNSLFDGFLAHELMTAVPQAVTGTKDQVDENNKPVYQQIDVAKVVPLLTAALQEAVTEIETLKAKVAALEGS